MHALAYVQIPGDTDLESFAAVYAAVTQAMGPYHEDSPGPEGFWDWWQIGGRWYRHFDTDYDPDKDPELTEPCRLCDSTGSRTDQIAVDNGMTTQKIEEPLFPKDHPRYGQVGTCNGCNSTGTATKWPTEWPQRVEGNVARRRDLSNDPPYTAVLFDGVFHVQGFLETTVPFEMQAAWNGLDPDAVLVVVDYHS